LKKYFMLAGNSFMTISIYRFNFIFASVGNIIYIMMIYFLWKSIYKGSYEINGMTFNQVMVYLTLAASIHCIFSVDLEWKISQKVLEGSIINNIIKPVDLQLQSLFETLGKVMCNLVTVTIPSFFIIAFVFKAEIHAGINILFFFLMLIPAFLISFSINYIVGLFSFYTESIWGIINTKDVLVLLLSGVAIPIDFFPPAIKQFVLLLPFQAIYNVPMVVLTSPDLELDKYIYYIGLQLAWVFTLFVIGKLFYYKASKVITINGG
jgi:ABC-2 type transport system permease protein